MATPSIVQSWMSSDDTSQSSITQSLSGTTSGNLLVAVCCSAELSSSFVYMNYPSGWVEKSSYTSTSVPFTGLCFRWADGNETSVTIGVDIDNRLSIMVFELEDVPYDVNPWHVIKSGITSSYITTPNIDGAITTLDNCLVISTFNAKSNATFSTAATGVLNHPPWTLIGNSNAAGTSGSVRQVASYRPMDTAGDSLNLTYSMGSTFIGREISFSIPGEVESTTSRRIFIS